MKDSKLPHRRKPRGQSNSPLTHPEDCFCDDCRQEVCRKVVIDRERGASGSDAASGQTLLYPSSLPFRRKKGSGAEFCNTAPSNNQSPLLSFIDPALSTGGFDYLSLSCYGEYDSEYWEQLVKTLEVAQTSAQDQNLPGVPLELIPGVEVQVTPSGKGQGFSYAKWKIKYRGIVFGICNTRNSQEVLGQSERFNLNIEISSMPLMTLGEMNLYDEIRSIFLGLNYHPYRIVPSRVDVCVDLVDVPVSRFANAIQGKRYISRSKKWTTIEESDQIQTLKLGSKGAQTILRIYDKYEECKPDKIKYDLLVISRWGKEPDPDLGATRVEFQIRRDNLRDLYGIRDFKDLIEKRRSLCDKLTHEFIRLTESVPDPNNSTRSGPSKLWQTVIEAFQAWTGEEIKSCQKREVIGADIDQLKRQTVGCMISLVALRGVIPQDEDELLDELDLIFSDEYETIVREIPFRRKRLEADRPFKIIEMNDKFAA